MLEDTVNKRYRNGTDQDTGKNEHQARAPPIPRILYTGTTSPYVEAQMLQYEGEFRHIGEPIYLCDTPVCPMGYAIQRARRPFNDILKQTPALIVVDTHKQKHHGIEQEALEVDFLTPGLSAGSFLVLNFRKADEDLYRYITQDLSSDLQNMSIEEVREAMNYLMPEYQDILSAPHQNKNHYLLHRLD